MDRPLYRGRVQNGRIVLDDDLTLPEGALVEIYALPEGITGAEILNSELMGLWADRDDIGDSVAFAEELRRKAERRDSE